MLHSFADYRNQLLDSAEESLLKTLDPPLDTDAFAITVLKERFMLCLEFKKLPPESLYFLHHFGIDLDDMNDGSSLEEVISRQRCTLTSEDVARSCEFYGGFFPGRVSSRNSSLSQSMIVSILSASYGSIARSGKIEYASFSPQSENIIAAFRRSASQFPWS